MDARQISIDNRIMECLSGSHAYGTSTPESDIDYRGLFVAPEIISRSPFYKIEQWQGDEGDDRVLYEIEKFMPLLVDQNPNIIELLWCDESDIIFGSDAYDYLRSNREKLLSSKAKFTFSGYAISQLNRINGHHKWINNPKPVNSPRQTDYVKLVHNFTNDKMFKFNIYDYHKGYRLIPYDTNLYGVYQHSKYETFSESFTLNTVYDHEEDFTSIHQKDLSWWDKILFRHSFMYENSVIRRMPLFIVKFCREEYLRAKDDWANYWTWKNNRNKKRSELEEKYGYDYKHAMHLIRLMRMCKEILEDGVVNVRRMDADDLLAIRNGKYTYDELISIAQDYDAEMDRLYKTTQLQKSVDIKFATEVLLTVQNIRWE